MKPRVIRPMAPATGTLMQEQLEAFADGSPELPTAGCLPRSSKRRHGKLSEVMFAPETGGTQYVPAQTARYTCLTS